MHTLSYGKKTVTFTLPQASAVDWITYRQEPVANESCLEQALNEPISSPALLDIAKGKKSAVIVISDSSRLCPSYLFLELVINILNTAGITDEQIKVIVALGMHRKQTKSELILLTGSRVFHRVEVLNHSPLVEDCVNMGTTSNGTPVDINRHVVEAELRMVTGNIEPHALAGVSGGLKAIVPGTASARCIEHNHSLSLQYTADIGDADNVIRKDLEEAAGFLPIHFLLNVVVNHKQQLLGAVAGHPIYAHQQALEFVKSIFLVEVPHPYDLVIVSPGGSPKDGQFYQSLKAFKNAAAITKPGGQIVGISHCGEGLGNGLLQYWVETIQDRSVMVQKLKEKFVLGPHKILHLDDILSKHKLHLFTEMPSSIVELLGLEPVQDLQHTINVLSSAPDIRCAIMPFGGLTFPKIAPQTHHIN